MERHELEKIIILVRPGDAKRLIVRIYKSLTDFAAEAEITCRVGWIRRNIFYRIVKVRSVSGTSKIRIILGVT